MIKVERRGFILPPPTNQRRGRAEVEVMCARGLLNSQPGDDVTVGESVNILPNIFNIFI